jgi:hypothetical protein
MRVKGVEFTPESYRNLADIDTEFNAGNENLAGLLKKIYTPLAGNVKADPQGWDFDSKGVMWSTMMGYNAMEKAQQRLSSTEVLPGISAAEVLADTGEPNYNPMGQNTVDLNYNTVGDMTREASKRVKGTDPLSPTETTTIRNEFAKAVEAERNKILQADPTMVNNPESEEQAKRAAAAMIAENYPDAKTVPEINQYLGGQGPVTPESPPEAATAPSPSSATQVPSTTTTSVSGLPAGSKAVKNFPNGDIGYVGPDGKKYIVKSKAGAGVPTDVMEQLNVPTGN